MQLFDIRPRRGVDQGFDGFFEPRVAIFGFEEARAREEEFAVEFEDFEQLGGDVGADYVFDADAGGFVFALLMGGEGGLAGKMVRGGGGGCRRGWRGWGM